MCQSLRCSTLSNEPQVLQVLKLFNSTELPYLFTTKFNSLFKMFNISSQPGSVHKQGRSFPLLDCGPTEFLSKTGYGAPPTKRMQCWCDAATQSGHREDGPVVLTPQTALPQQREGGCCLLHALPPVWALSRQGNGLGPWVLAMATDRFPCVCACFLYTLADKQHTSLALAAHECWWHCNSCGSQANPARSSI